MAQLAVDGDVWLVSLEVIDADSVRPAAAHIAAKTGPLDVLVNNAGAAVPQGEGRPSTVQLETIQRTFDVNLYGALRVIQAFLSLMQQAKASRIVNVSSTLGSLTNVVSEGNPFGKLPFFAYPASKTLLNAVTGWLAVELKDSPIKVNSVCPGSNSTDMNSDPDAQHPA